MKKDEKKLRFYYAFAEDVPANLSYTLPFHFYFKGSFTWFVKEDIADHYFHYTRMPSGRIMYRISLLPF